MPAIQSHRFAALGSPLGDDVLLLKHLRGREELGCLFEYHVELLSEDYNVKFDDIVGENVTIRLEVDTDTTRYFNGFVKSFEMLEPENGYCRYDATVVPWTWFLTQSWNCQIFQEMTVPEIIEAVFNNRGFSDFELGGLSGSYEPLEYCVQYRESDFNFVSRLMEEVGIYYFFTHENGSHMMVLADSSSAHDPCPKCETVAYHSPTISGGTRSNILHFKRRKQVVTGIYEHRDFDFKQPKDDLTADEQISRDHAVSECERYDYPGGYINKDTGEDLAKVRIEELHAPHEVFTGKADARGLQAGFTFTLTDFHATDLNQPYLLTAVTHEINQGLFASGGDTQDKPYYEASFEAVVKDTPYRSARRADKKLVNGPQTAIVTGPSGEEIHTDEYGRVKVKFHWDRYGVHDDKSSCFIRVSQAWAGKNWGAMYIPRIGQEVIVEFLEGDPDRPIITGRVYNGESMPPYDLPSEKTKSTLKSNSSKDAEGFNEIRFEDKAGEEQVFIHAQKNQDNRVLNNSFEWVGNSRHLVVKADQFEHVENNRSEQVDSDHMEEIGKDRHVKVKGKEAIEVGDSHTLTVKGDVVEVFKANHSEKTTQDYYLTAMGIVIESKQGITLKTGGNSVVIDSKGVTIKGSIVTIDSQMCKINSGPGSSPASGKAGKPVSPTAPENPEEADVADPGKVAEFKAKQKKDKKGKYGSTPVKPFKPPVESETEEEEKSWIEIEMVDEDDNPVSGEKYKIELPDGSVASGTLNGNGFARVQGFDPGQCKVTFPNLDKDAWEKA